MAKKYHFGVGVDVELIERFRNLDKVKNRSFLDKVYTSHELEYSYALKNPGPYLAEQFCGKEAVIKALTTIGHNGIHYSEIMITNSEDRGPTVSLLKDSQDVILHLGVSHSRDTAIAFALAIRQDKAVLIEGHD